MIDLDRFFRFIKRDVVMATYFWRNLQNDLQAAGWRFEANGNMAVPIQKGSMSIL